MDCIQFSISDLVSIPISNRVSIFHGFPDIAMERLAVVTASHLELSFNPLDSKGNYSATSNK